MVDRLRKVAEAVENGGSWYVAEDWGSKLIAEGPDDINYIATFDPPTVLALLDVVEAAEKFAVDAHDLARCRPHRPDARPCPTCDPFHEALGRLGGDTP